MKNDWVRLDNAAKIFPAAVSDADNQVFRFSCDLIETVDVQCLQRALLETTRFFPVFQVTMKRGLFWYYLERTDLLPQVQIGRAHV